MRCEAEKEGKAERGALTGVRHGQSASTGPVSRCCLSIKVGQCGVWCVVRLPVWEQERRCGL